MASKLSASAQKVADKYLNQMGSRLSESTAEAEPSPKLETTVRLLETVRGTLQDYARTEPEPVQLEYPPIVPTRWGLMPDQVAAMQAQQGREIAERNRLRVAQAAERERMELERQKLVQQETEAAKQREQEVKLFKMQAQMRKDLQELGLSQDLIRLVESKQLDVANALEIERQRQEGRETLQERDITSREKIAEADRTAAMERAKLSASTQEAVTRLAQSGAMDRLIKQYELELESPMNKARQEYLEKHGKYFDALADAAESSKHANALGQIAAAAEAMYGLPTREQLLGLVEYQRATGAISDEAAIEIKKIYSTIPAPGDEAEITTPGGRTMRGHFVEGPEGPEWRGVEVPSSEAAGGRTVSGDLGALVAGVTKMQSNFVTDAILQTLENDPGVAATTYRAVRDILVGQ